MIPLRRTLLGVICIAVFALPAAAQSKKDGGRVNWSETKVAFDMRGKTWDATIKWFCQQTQMPLIGKYPPPAGTVNFFNVNGPDNKPRQYTLAEVFDVLNEMLMAEHKHILLRGENTLMLHPADEPIDRLRVPQIDVGELPERGRSEIVEVAVKLKGHLNAVGFAPQARKLLGAWAVVTPLEDTNQLVIQCNVEALRRNLKHFAADPKEIQPADSAHSFAHKCAYIRASAAEALLRKALGPLQEEVVKSAGPTEKGAPAPQVKSRITTITSDKATNTIFISGPSTKIDQAKIILKNADVARYKGDKGILIGAPLFRTHDVAQGNAEAMAKILADIFKDETIRITIQPPASLLIYADPQTHLEIDRLRGEPAPAQKTELVTLWRLDAGRFAENLREIFPESRHSAPYIGADLDSNGIRIRGTAEQIKAVRDVIRELDGKQGTTRIFSLDKASGATVVEAIQQLFPKVRDNPIEITLPSGEPTIERVQSPKMKK